jgi:hypothetical protein
MELHQCGGRKHRRDEQEKIDRNEVDDFDPRAGRDLHQYEKCGARQHKEPTVLDVIVTRDPARMLPGVDSRTLTR